MASSATEQCSLDPLAGFKGPTSKGREGSGKEGAGEEGKEGKGTGEGSPGLSRDRAGNPTVTPLRPAHHSESTDHYLPCVKCGKTPALFPAFYTYSIPHSRILHRPLRSNSPRVSYRYSNRRSVIELKYSSAIS